MTRLVVIAGFLVSFAAGVLVGMEARKRPNVTAGASTIEPTTQRSRSSWITSELGLTSDQQKALDKIWSETAGRGRGEMEDRRRQIRKERDDALTALVRPEDKAKYDEIFKNYQEQQAAIERDMRANFENAVRLTKEQLTPCLLYTSDAADD